MERSEWIEGVQLIRAYWPHQPIPDSSIAIWFEDLRHLPAEQVHTAVKALYRDGREFAPNGGQILAKVAELDFEDTDYGEAWRLARKAALKADAEEGRAWLAERCPAAVVAVERLTGWPLTYMNDDEPTVRAQFRGIYQSLIDAQRRDARYSGLPSAGLRQLERGPRKLGEALQKALPRKAA